MKHFHIIIIWLSAILLLFSCKEPSVTPPWEWPDDPEVPQIPVTEKPRILWMDASANFQYLANSRENIAHYIGKAKDAGFTEIIVDVRPGSGDVLFKSTIVDQVKKLRNIERTATWDYLEAFIEEGHRQGLKVNASVNVMVGGSTSNGGVVYREPDKAAWTTMMYLPNGSITSVMNVGEEPEKFFNPINTNAQNYILSIIRELAANYPDLDGIVMDRGRFQNMKSDFSDLTRTEFENYIGQQVASFPSDIFTWNGDNVVPGIHYKKWLEFRAKVIYDFFVKLKNTVKVANKNVRFGSYTGAWYSTYYDVGVNWASQQYDTSKYYSWATPEYKNFGYAKLLDFYMSGAYGKTLYQSNSEWAIDGAILKAKQVIKGDVPVIGSLYGLNYFEKPQDCEEAVYICLTTGDGLMFFDMIYLIMYDQWNNVKKGIDRALAVKK